MQERETLSWKMLVWRLTILCIWLNIFKLGCRKAGQFAVPNPVLHSSSKTPAGRHTAVSHYQSSRPGRLVPKTEPSVRGAVQQAEHFILLPGIMCNTCIFILTILTMGESNDFLKWMSQFTGSLLCLVLTKTLVVEEPNYSTVNHPAGQLPPWATLQAKPNHLTLDLIK